MDHIEEIEQFIAEHTQLPLDRVSRIYRQGMMWPIPDKWNLWPSEEDTEQVRIDKSKALAALSPLIEMELEHMQARVEEYRAAQARGEMPDLPFTRDPEVDDHIQEVSRLTGEDLETVESVYSGYLAFKQAEFAKMQEMMPGPEGSSKSQE